MSALGMGSPPQGAPGFPPSIQIGGASGPGPQDAGSSSGDGDWEDDLQQAIAALRALEADAQDHQEAAIVAQCVLQLRKLSASRQSGAESALGITPAMKAMKRAGYSNS